MVKKLSVFVGIVLVSMFVFSSVVYSSHVHQMKAENRVLAADSRDNYADVSMKGADSHLIYNPGAWPVPHREFIYWGPGYERYPDKFGTHYPYPVSQPHRFDYQPVYPSTYDQQFKGRVYRTLDERIFALLDELSAVGMIALYFFIRIMYTNWFRPQKKKKQPRLRLPF
ncbi:hypothetical protein [Salipaludibacillus aurantiacus]|uniref:Uncharacterized protein n=1 Tax=Salipaludibacillus aurantiacus TaxID=1601833 RepID=A0A1H9WAK6_9BACI|nr:hypothetical protein [Salipaludibacillus aurantiacus]SES30819.1 hypothetical protein SAMN05518684_11586 [Salipaludibacillus aurantiacus]